MLETDTSRRNSEKARISGTLLKEGYNNLPLREVLRHGILCRRVGCCYRILNNLSTDLFFRAQPKIDTNTTAAVLALKFPILAIL